MREGPAAVTGVVIGIPAHDEEAEVAGALAAVLVAARGALLAGAAARVHVVLAAHRCRDRTAACAAEALTPTGQTAGLTAEVLDDRVSQTVGQVRDRALRAGLERLGWREGAADPPWLLCTDADSRVPTDWVQAVLAEAAPGIGAVAGLVDLAGWQAGPAAQREYRSRVATGLHAGGHWHAYGANLAVRADVYLAVGGFPRRVHGEDVGLVRALREAGVGVATPTDLRVATSARSPGRARGGLGDLLGELDAPCDARDRPSG